LRQPSLDRSTPEIHLKQTILRLHESLREKQIVLVACRDVRDAPSIANDGHRLMQSADAQRAVHLRQRRLRTSRWRRRSSAGCGEQDKCH
jgi:hypothetical protein